MGKTITYHPRSGSPLHPQVRPRPLSPIILPTAEEELIATAERAKAMQQNPMTHPPDWRPLSGADIRQVGSSANMVPGDSKLLVDCRTDGVNVAEKLTVTLGSSLIGSFVVAPIGISAHVEWGSGTAQFAADVDFANGLSFSVGGSYVRVTANYTQPAAPPGNTLQVNAAVARGTAAGPHSPARLTQNIGLVPNGGTTAIFIPPFAVAMTLFGATVVGTGVIPAPGFDIEFNLSTVVGRYAFKDFSNDGHLNPSTAIPIPGQGGNVQCTLINNCGSDARIGIIWSLALN